MVSRLSDIALNTKNYTWELGVHCDVVVRLEEKANFDDLLFEVVASNVFDEVLGGFWGPEGGLGLECGCAWI